MKRVQGLDTRVPVVRATVAALIAIGLVACGGGTADDSIGSLRLIGEQRIPLRQAFQGTVVGGLSGIDYDAASDNWIMISDDKGDLSPPRFYTAKLRYDERQFSAVDLREVTFFKQADGSQYPNRTQYATRGGEVADPEAIRFDPRDGSIWWTSEGDRALGLHPFFRHVRRDGSHIETLPTPDMFKMVRDQQSGSRQNLSYESLTFATDGGSLWQTMEGPIYQDGAPTTANAGAVARVSRYDRSGKMLAQYAYQVGAVPFVPSPGGVAENGVAEMLAIDDHRFLVLERTVVQTAPANALKFAAR
ncbi:MAG: esterase-like activity of phytase family protein, partial [Noviherbaspirillum sp.]